MRIAPNRVLRPLFIAAVLIPTVAACAAVGGGGDVDSDCESDVSGSEFTPVATGAYDDSGESCNNNEFVDTDLDAYAYPPSSDDNEVGVVCKGGAASFTLFEVENGIPSEALSGICDGEFNARGNVEGTSYVLVIEHGAESEGAEFEVSLGNN